MAGALDKEVYQSRCADLARMVEQLEKQIAESEAKFHEAEVVKAGGLQDTLEVPDRYAGATELNQEIMNELIE